MKRKYSVGARCLSVTAILMVSTVFSSCQLMNIRGGDSGQKNRYLKVGESRTATLPAQGAHIYFTAVESASNLVFDVKASQGSTVDPVIVLLNNEGQKVGVDDDGGGGKNARLAVSANKGEYTAVVSGYGNTAGEYTIALSAGDRAQTGPGQQGTAVPQMHQGGIIGVGESKTGMLNQGDIHSYSLNVPSKLMITIDLVNTGNSALDPMLQLQNNAGADIAKDDDGGGARNSRIIKFLEPGTYTIKALSYQNTSGQYQLRVAGTEGRTLPLGQGMNGVLNSGERKVYLFSAAKEGLYTISLNRAGNSALDPALILQNEQGQNISSDDDSGEGLNAKIETFLSPGTYLLFAYGSDPGSGAYAIQAARKNITPQQQTTLGVNTAAEGWIFQNSRHTYSISLQREGLYSFDCAKADTGNLDPMITLENENRIQLDSDDDGGGNRDAKILRLMNPGKYMLNVTSVGASSGKYRLSANVIGLRTISLGKSVNNSLEAGEIHAYRLTLTKNTHVTIDQENSGQGNLDPYLVVLDKSGGKITDDDSGGNRNARINRELIAGDYIVVAKGLGVSRGGYKLSVNPFRAVPDVQTSISLGETRVGSLHSSGQRVSYSLTIASAGTVIIRAKQATGSTVDAVVELYDAQGVMVASDDDSGGNRNALLIRQLNPGNYRVVVRSYGNNTGNFLLSIVSAGN